MSKAEYTPLRSLIYLTANTRGGQQFTLTFYGPFKRAGWPVLHWLHITRLTRHWSLSNNAAPPSVLYYSVRQNLYSVTTSRRTWHLTTLNSVLCYIMCVCVCVTQYIVYRGRWWKTPRLCLSQLTEGRLLDLAGTSASPVHTFCFGRLIFIFINVFGRQCANVCTPLG